MKKLLLVLISILFLAGTGYCAEMSQAITADYTAQNTGRSVITDTSVVFQVYYRGTGANPTVGISSDTILLTDDGATDVSIDTTSSSYNTTGEVVDYINSDADWVAIIGPDSYRDHDSGAAYIARNQTAVGSTKDGGISFYGDSSTVGQMTCGVEADATAQIRLKSIEAELASKSDDIAISVYDGNTKIWTKTIPDATYISATAVNASPNTIVMPGKGLATTKGNSLCVVVDSSGVPDTDATAKLIDNVSIVYDKLRD